MKRRIFIQHKGFNIFMGNSVVTDEQVAAARAALIEATEPKEEKKTKKSAASKESDAA